MSYRREGASSFDPVKNSGHRFGVEPAQRIPGPTFCCAKCETIQPLKGRKLLPVRGLRQFVCAKCVEAGTNDRRQAA